MRLPIRSDTRLWSESYLIRSGSGFTFGPLVLFPFFGCGCLVGETALLYVSVYFLFCPLSLLFTRLFHFYSLSALCCVAICRSCLCQCSVCLPTCLCVCVCLLIYFFRSSFDALEEGQLRSLESHFLAGTQNQRALERLGPVKFM